MKHYNGSNIPGVGETQRTSARQSRHLRWYAHDGNDRMTLEELICAFEKCEFNTYSAAYAWQVDNHNRAERQHQLFGLTRLKECVDT